MPSDKLDLVRLLCETSGAEGLPQYAVISLTSAKIRSILSQHAAFMALKIVLDEAEMLRLLNCGDVDYYDTLREFPPKSMLDFERLSYSLYEAGTVRTRLHAAREPCFPAEEAGRYGHRIPMPLLALRVLARRL